MPYQPLIPSGPSGSAGAQATAAKAKAVDNIASAVQALSIGLMNEAVKRQIVNAVEKLEQRIQRQIPARGGVLVEVLIYEGPKGVEFPLKFFKGVYVAGSGRDPSVVMKRYLAEPKMYDHDKDYNVIQGWLWITK